MITSKLLEEKIAKLENQLEQMKSCDNCKDFFTNPHSLKCRECRCCEKTKLPEWEINDEL